MSTLKVGAIRGVSASSDAITVANDGTCSANITNNLSNRNLIINGSQTIDQRNAGSNVTAHLAYVTDRFRIIKDTSSGSFTAARSTDAPSGFTNSFLFTTGTAYTPSASENNFIKYVIEGNDSAQLYFGNSGAKTITLSFYVKSSLTGNFAAMIGNGASNRSFPFLYSIGSANTWTRITKTITGDVTGTWATDNTAGVQIAWTLSSGSNFEGTADTWQGSDEFAVSGHVKVTSTAGATFAITGVQFEVGEHATDFEHRSFGDELALCQRYYQRIDGSTVNTIFGVGNVDGSTQGQILVTLGTPLRVKASSMETTGSAGDYKFRVRSTVNCDAVPTLVTAGFTQQFLEWHANSHGFSDGDAALGISGSSSSFLAFSAEL
jgi:hypothetical protein